MNTLTPVLSALCTLLLLTTAANAQVLQGGVEQVEANPSHERDVGVVQLPDNVNHGQYAPGVLGCLLRYQRDCEVILRVFPESDLNRFNIQPGDKILAINGIPPTSIRDSLIRCEGMPGSFLNLTVDQHGQVREISVRRVDIRAVVKYSNMDTQGWYQQMAGQVRYW